MLLQVSKGNEPYIGLILPEVFGLCVVRARKGASLRVLSSTDAQGGLLEGCHLPSGKDGTVQPNTTAQAQRDFPPCIQTK